MTSVPGRPRASTSVEPPGGAPRSRTALAGQGVVATTDRYASEVGIEILRSGGNAIDAAVAVAFSLAVVNPEAGNIGGGGFLVARDPLGEMVALDFRSVGPAAATRDMFIGPDGAVSRDALVGPLSAAVPGSVRGLWDAHRRLGSRPWAELLEPAIAQARGFLVEERLVRSLPARIVEALRQFPASARVFLPRTSPSDPGEPLPPAVGDVFRQPDLARTLERVRDQGAAGFYGGETAELIAAEMDRGGGIITREDLEGYATRWREPLRFSYRGYPAVTMPPSSAGGVTLVETAHILDAFGLADLPWHGAGHVHRLAEAWRRAHADRNRYVSDPDFLEVPLAKLAAPEYGALRAGGISKDRATPSVQVGPGLEDFGPRHTTHVSIVDPFGGVAALTTTINTWFGSKTVVDGAGFLLNNDMNDFSVAAGRPNYYGLVQGAANAIAAGKRMASAMTPTIVLAPDGSAGREDLFMVLGTPGGATIPTTVFQVVSNVVDFGLSLRAAVDAPRVHHQHLPDRIRTEPGALADNVVRTLERMGHEVLEGAEPWGDVQAIGVLADGSLEGVSDGRMGGAPLGL